MCSLRFFNSGREDKVFNLFSVSITSVSCLADQFFSIVATSDGSIVIAVSSVTATCFLKVKFSS